MAKHNMTPLGAQYPDVAKWLVNPDDASLPCHSPKKVMWSCALGHEWSAPIRNRTQLGAGCLICSGQRVQIGFNDAWTTEPGICASLKNGEDGYTHTSGSNKKVAWVCASGHEWVTSFKHRRLGTGCPICQNKKTLAGYNDLWTDCPDIAAELDDDSIGYRVTCHSGVRALFNCPDVPEHQWTARIADRTRGRGCPQCARHGFDHDSREAVLYLVSPPSGNLIFGKVSSVEMLTNAMKSDYSDCRLIASTAPGPAAAVSDAELFLIQQPDRPRGTRRRAINESLDRSDDSVELWRRTAESHGLRTRMIEQPSPQCLCGAGLTARHDGKNLCCREGRQQAYTAIRSGHYLGTVPKGSVHVFTRRNINGDVIAAMTLGSCSHASIAKSVAPASGVRVLELTRLWAVDGHDFKMSNFVNECLGLIDYPLFVVSYADSSRHGGTVYRASGFNYAGWSSMVRAQAQRYGEKGTKHADREATSPKHRFWRLVGTGSRRQRREVLETVQWASLDFNMMNLDGGIMKEYRQAKRVDIAAATVAPR